MGKQIFSAPEKDGYIRFGADNRMLYNLNQQNLYTIPRMDEGIDFLGEATVF